MNAYIELYPGKGKLLHFLKLFGNMENSKKWEKFVRSGSYNRSLKKYSDITVPETFQNVHETETSTATSDPASYRNSSSQVDWRPAVPLAENDDEFSELEDVISQIHEDYYSPDNVADYSPDNDANYEYVEEDLSSFLQSWSLENKISHAALKPLLARLSQYDRTLPEDPRRLLITPRKPVAVVKIQGGQYWHQGLENCLRYCFTGLAAPRSISININIDGLPLFKNGTDQVWPILFNVHEEVSQKPMIIGIFHGKTKPKRVEEYLGPFVEEAVPILNSGIVINGHLLKVKIRAFVCDSPARAFIKGSVNFNAFHGCLKCTAVGERQHELHINVFPTTVAPKRTDIGFRNKAYDGHHQVYKVRENGKSRTVYVETPLLWLPMLDMVEDIIVRQLFLHDAKLPNKSEAW
ncbi:uncharacterized protein LOC134210711 [Armigeres subalbatus]|uniref:uncharacterized protein LOC134210711 n=1 Tax=Armigeres subalbatus TaxID=124917 RepID=UPI002ED478C2